MWETVSDVRWPYAFAPIVDCQNLPAPNEYWGVSDIEDDLIEITDASNFIMSNLVKRSFATMGTQRHGAAVSMKTNWTLLWIKPFFCPRAVSA